MVRDWVASCPVKRGELVADGDAPDIRAKQYWHPWTRRFRLPPPHRRMATSEWLAERTSAHVGHAVVSDALLLQQLGTMVHQRSRGAVVLDTTETVAYAAAGWLRDVRRATSEKPACFA